MKILAHLRGLRGTAFDPFGRSPERRRERRLIAGERPSHSAEERGEDAVLAPEAIAEAYYQLHVQPRSTWTQELDLRPCLETF